MKSTIVWNQHDDRGIVFWRKSARVSSIHGKREFWSFFARRLRGFQSYDRCQFPSRRIPLDDLHMRDQIPRVSEHSSSLRSRFPWDLKGGHNSGPMRNLSMNVGFDIVLSKSQCLCQFWTNFMERFELEQEQEEEEEDPSIYLLIPIYTIILINH